MKIKLGKILTESSLYVTNGKTEIQLDEEADMESFMEALLSKKSDKIPEEYDWFAPLIGDWDLDYHDGYDTGSERTVKGEWLFRRVLNGAGIEDLFICPSRDTMYSNPQPDGEYGMVVRMFNHAKKCYDMVYACEKYMCNLCFVREDKKLIGTVLDNPSQKWIFSDIKEDSFHWQNVTILENGEWKVNSNIYAKSKSVSV